jgi:hypothetical protein
LSLFRQPATLSLSLSHALPYRIHFLPHHNAPSLNLKRRTRKEKKEKKKGHRKTGVLKRIAAITHTHTFSSLLPPLNGLLSPITQR